MGLIGNAIDGGVALILLYLAYIYGVPWVSDTLAVNHLPIQIGIVILAIMTVIGIFKND